MWEYAERSGLAIKMRDWLKEHWSDEWPEPEWPVAIELSESALERILYAQICDRTKIPLPVQQLRFAAGRDYRADFAWPDHRLLVEVDGGLWIGGKHAIALHETRRQRRRIYAQALGWSIVEVGPPDVRSGAACDLIERWLTDPHQVCQLLDTLDTDDTAEEAL